MLPEEILPYFMERIAMTAEHMLREVDPLTLLVKLPDDFIVDGNLNEEWRDEFNIGMRQLIQQQTGCIMLSSQYVDLHILYRIASKDSN
jgi:hypothetical protein